MTDTSSESSVPEFEANSSSEDDELLGIARGNRRRPKNENYLGVTVPQYIQNEFKDHFRLPRNIVDDTALRFSQSEYFKHQAGGYGKISPNFVFLWYASHEAASFRDVADRFDITISCLFYITRRVTYFLSNLAPAVIKWPNQEERRVIESFFREKGFPGIIEAIDGSHVKINKPQNDPDSYLNRKHYHSIQMQVVCDHNLVIHDLFMGYPGSVHDSRVFRNSPLYETLQENCGDFFLLGDSGYPCLRNLLTPYKDRGNVSRVETNFNNKLSRNRYYIEHCFGVLHQKWRQLYHVKLHKVEDIVHFIRACCVLHNLGIEKCYMNIDNVEREQEDPQAHMQPAALDEGDDRDGINHRNFIARQLFRA